MKEKDAVCVFCSYKRINENSEEILRPTYAKKIVTIKDMKVMNYIGCLSGLYDTTRHGKIYLKESLKSIRMTMLIGTILSHLKMRLMEIQKY